eukprot:752989-Amphidinium_carterae.1
MIQDYNAVRGQSLSPRAEAGNPYSTPVVRQQALSVDGPQRAPQAAKLRRLFIRTVNRTMTQ